MKSRERLLAIIVGCLALVFVGRWVWGLVTSPLNSRYATLEQLDKDIAKQNDIAFEGKKADRKLAYTARAVADLQAWQAAL